MTELRKKFCEEYIKDFNGAAAARRAGYSEKNSDRQAYILLQDEKVQKRIQKLASKASERNELEVDALIQELMLVAFQDIGEMVEDDGDPLPISELPDKARKAISGIRKRTYKEGHSVEIRTYDKLDAIEKLMRYLGAYEADNRQKSELEIRQKSTEELKIMLANIRKRRNIDEEE